MVGLGVFWSLGVLNIRLCGFWGFRRLMLSSFRRAATPQDVLVWECVGQHLRQPPIPFRSLGVLQRTSWWVGLGVFRSPGEADMRPGGFWGYSTSDVVEFPMSRNPSGCAHMGSCGAAPQAAPHLISVSWRTSTYVLVGLGVSTSDVVEFPTSRNPSGCARMGLCGQHLRQPPFPFRSLGVLNIRLGGSGGFRQLESSRFQRAVIPQDVQL